MGRRSSVAQLPPEILDRVHALIREGRTGDEILAALDRLGADVSRSAVYRYKANMEEKLARYREAQEVAGVWVRELGQDADDKIGRLLGEMIKLAAFQTVSQLSEDGATTSPEDIMLLAKAVKDLIGARKTSAELELKIRREVAAEAAKVAMEVATRRGLSAEAVADLKAGFLGLARA